MSKLHITATFGMKSDTRETVLLNNVMVNGTLFREHTWVEFHPKMAEFENGDTIEFSAVYHTYMGLTAECKYIQKRGFKKITNLNLVCP